MYYSSAVLSPVPRLPGLYCVYGGGPREYAAYVGIASDLKSRLIQHLIRQDSSVTTGVSTAALNVTRVTAIAWWTGPVFEEKSSREASEIIAFEILNPILRSRGSISAGAHASLASAGFRERATAALNAPAGRIDFPSYDSLAAEVRELRAEVEELKRILSAKLSL